MNYICANFLVVVLCHSHARCYHQGKQSKMYIEFLCIVSYNCMWLHYHHKIKIPFIKTTIKIQLNNFLKNPLWSVDMGWLPQYLWAPWTQRTIKGISIYFRLGLRPITPMECWQEAWTGCQEPTEFFCSLAMWFWASHCLLWACILTEKILWGDHIELALSKQSNTPSPSLPLLPLYLTHHIHVKYLFPLPLKKFLL